MSNTPGSEGIKVLKQRYCPVTHSNGSLPVIDVRKVLSEYGKDASLYIHQIISVGGGHMVCTYPLQFQLNDSKWKDLQNAALRGEVFGYACYDIVPILVGFCRELDSNPSKTILELLEQK